MLQCKRRNFFTTIGSLCLWPLFYLGKANAEQDKEDNWAKIKSEAFEFVENETQERHWPFEANQSKVRLNSQKRVWIHYFTPLPLSLDNLPPIRDYYAISGLQRSGENKKYFVEGGYLRSRPISPSPWPGKKWRLRNASIDVFRALKIGADGFMLDIDWLQPTGQLHQIIEAICSATDNIDRNFFIGLQPDMASLSAENPAQIADALSSLATSHPSIYHLDDGRLLVAPFAPDNRSVDYWESFIKEMASRGHIVALLPVILNWSKSKAFEPIAYGFSSWGVREAADANEMAEGTKAGSSKLETWMLPIAPQDERPNSSIYWESNNTRLFRKLWEAAIETDAPQVHLITWNDFSETTSVEPSSDSQFVFYDLAAYYISWFKLGKRPRITKDAIYYTHRRQLVHDGQVAIEGDRPMKRLGTTEVANNIELLAFLTAPAKLQIQIADNVYFLDADEGVQEFQVPATFGRPTFRIIRNEVEVQRVTSAWEISNTLDRDDFTYYGGSSSRISERKDG